MYLLSGKPSSTSTTRGLDGEAFALVGNLVADVWEAVDGDGAPDATLVAGVVARVREQVAALCSQYPIYN